MILIKIISVLLNISSLQRLTTTMKIIMAKREKFQRMNYSIFHMNTRLMINIINKLRPAKRLLDMLKSHINSFYLKHNTERVCQGDILRDFSFYHVDADGAIQEIVFPYMVVISQDCDLERASTQSSLDTQNTYQEIKQYLPNLIFVPAFVDEQVKTGTHLEELFGIKQEIYDTKRWRPILQNNNERYHSLAEDRNNSQIPNLVVDFKLYYTVSYEVFLKKYRQCYLSTINELFREKLSQRFCNYLSRIGVPELQFAKI